MQLPSNKTLVKFALYIGIAGISSVMYMRWKIEERIRNTDYYKAALKILRQHKGAISVLGEPIKDMGLDISDPMNSCDGHKANLNLWVKGSKERGKIHFSATNDEGTGWLIDCLQLELKSQPDKRFIIKSDNERNNSPRLGKSTTFAYMYFAICITGSIVLIIFDPFWLEWPIAGMLISVTVK